MLQDDLLTFIATRYGLAPIQQATPIRAGYLSQNHALATAHERYFLKRYYFFDPDRVATVQEATFHFANAGIPALTPLRDRGGNAFFTWAEGCYALFPFVKGRQLRRGAMSDTALASAGEMLAAIHLAGRRAHLPNLPTRHKPPNVDDFYRTAEHILSLIAQQPVKTEFDELTKVSIALQMRLAHKGDNRYAALDLPRDHVIHGDYHEANLFFDVDDRVQHVYDWDAVSIGSRAFELVRGMKFMCFQLSEGYMTSYEAHNFARAASFLHGYQKHYPLAKAELEAAIRARYLAQIYSLWPEADHYFEYKTRTDQLLRPKVEFLTYASQHLETFIGRVSDALFIPS